MLIKGASRYDITESGIITDLLSNKVIKLSLNPRYKVCNLHLDDGTYKLCYLHRLLGTMFIPNPDNKPVINHIDSNKLNNSLDNLEWVTHKENAEHSVNSKGLNQILISKDCKACTKTFTSRMLDNRTYCSVECFHKVHKLDTLTKFIQYGKEFINWAITNYPLTYLGTLCNCSDNGLRKRLKLQGFILTRQKQYSKNRPNSIEELYNLYTSLA